MPSRFTNHEKYSDSHASGVESDILNADVYVKSRHGCGSEKVGDIDTALIDECDRLRYLALATGDWAAGKRVLLPIGRCMDDPERNRIYVAGLTKPQIADLPAYSDSQAIDPDYEAQVRSVYLAPTVEQSAPVEGEVPVESMRVKRYLTHPPSANVAAGNVAAGTDQSPPANPQPVDSPPTSATPADAEADLYRLGPDHHRFKLYEERLVAAKQRHKTGAVTVSKRVETHPAEATVPVRKEKIVIEIEAVDGATQVNLPDRTLQDNDTAQMAVHEEAATIRKEPVVRQQINIRKEVDEDTQHRQAELRRETLDIHKEGEPEVRDRPRS